MDPVTKIVAGTEAAGVVLMKDSRDVHGGRRGEVRAWTRSTSN